MVEKIHAAVILLSLASVGLLISTIVLGSRGRKVKYRTKTEYKNVTQNVTVYKNVTQNVTENVTFPPTANLEDYILNQCGNYASKDLKFENINCTTYPQAATDVTVGFNGTLNTTALYNGEVAVAETKPYNQTGMCAVNVHWHLGTEHKSDGQYGDFGTGPSDIGERRLAAGKKHRGGQCTLYDKNDTKFTTNYTWEYCTDMEVGQTYEVHWPHSAFGACDTKWQYQSPFKTGVFCKVNAKQVTDFLTKTRELLPQKVGVQAQVFTIVNDVSGDFDYPNLFEGMIVNGEMGKDMAYYLGSTTGQSVSNAQDGGCSPYSPITWQVDRTCHKIQAKSFDNMCKTMSLQAADMSGDYYPHGSRVVVDAANTGIKNGGSLPVENRALRGL